MDRGLYRFYGGRVDHFRSQDGLSGDSVYCFYEDHEGNLWVATTGGVDSFRDLSVTTFSTREGLGSGEADSVLAARDGTVWIGGAGSLDALREGRISSIRERKGLPGNQVTSLLEDHAGRLWVGLDNTLSIYRNGRFDRIAMPDGSPIGLVVGLAEDMTNDIWAEVRGSPRKLVRIQDLKVQEVFPAPETPPARRVAADQKRGVWLGLMNGDLAQIRSGNLEVFPFNYGPRPMKHSDVNQLLVTSDGSILGATAFGLVAWVSGKRQILTVQNGLPCDQIFGLVADNQQNLWLYTQCGLIEVARTDLQAWQDNPGIKVRYRLFDVFDGVQPGNAPFAPAVKSPDGRLWFVNGSVLQMIDPAHLKKNTIPPPVHVEEIVADGKSYSPIDGVRLPPHPHNTEIDYTALSFVAVRNVRFRYKLEGYDTVWAEPGTRRQAFYNLLRPGRYRFRVIGCNNDGVWNDVGASLNFDVLPAWYQTNSFRSFCAMSGFIVVWCLYKLRVSRIARAIGARFEERLAERTRLARELHDTFLQTIQGSKMVADNALKHSADTARIHRAVEDLSVWLGQAMCEARTALHSLRTTDRSDLVETLQQATESDLLPSPMAVTFSVHGDVKEMDPMVHDEVYCIAYEAIRNACRHSGASRLEVQLNYARDLTLRLTDDGIGIEPKIVAAGRWGHFGLQGMRERAIRIRSKLTIDSSAKSGTGITLVVPGSVAFRKASANWRTATPWGCGYRRALLAKIRNLLGLEE
jgi:signal transduction histidine kinase